MFVMKVKVFYRFYNVKLLLKESNSCYILRCLRPLCFLYFQAFLLLSFKQCLSYVNLVLGRVMMYLLASLM